MNVHIRTLAMETTRAWYLLVRRSGPRLGNIPSHGKYQILFIQPDPPSLTYIVGDLANLPDVTTNFW
jgi:hypothetical protein